MDISWIRELPLLVKGLLVLVPLLVIAGIIAWRKSKNPTGRHR